MTTAPDTTSDRWTLARLLGWTSDYFEKRGVDQPRLSSEVLLAHALNCRRIDLYARFDSEPTEQATKRFRKLVEQAANHKPIAYLVGEKDFFSLALHVTPDVLIPRSETETLVERVIEHCCAPNLKAPATLLDIGTGSGCIAIAVLSQLKFAWAVATDVLPAALEVAKQNADRHGVRDRIVFVEADRLALPEKVVPAGGFDVVMSNPPYVPAGEVSKLAPTVRDYEPHGALTDNVDGLSFYRAIAGDAPRILHPGGIVFVEIADGQEKLVRDAFTDSRVWTHAGTWKDSVTGRERVMAFARTG